MFELGHFSDVRGPADDVGKPGGHRCSANRRPRM